MSIPSRTIQSPVPGTYPGYYELYFNYLNGRDLVTLLDDQSRSYTAWIRMIPETHWGYRYAEGKWTVAQVLGHILDSERIMTTRALCIARGETQVLPGYDEDAYAAVCGYEGLRPAAVAAEWEAIRKSTLMMIRNFPDSAFSASGTANGKPVTVTAILHLLAGHAAHHVHVLHERYGLPAPLV